MFWNNITSNVLHIFSNYCFKLWFDIFKSLRGVPGCNSQADEVENFIG